MDIREIAIELYQSLLKGKTDTDFHFDGESQEKAFVKRLVMTALRKQEFIKKIIQQYSAKPLPKKFGIEHFVLIVGAAELLYFSTPQYAIVSSYVNIIKKIGNKYAAGFVNAILRKMCIEHENITRLSDTVFFPKSFRKILADDYRPQQISAIEKFSALEPPLDITVKNNAPYWAEKLGGTLLPNSSVRLKNAGVVNDLPGYNDGQWWVQDMASSLAVTALGDIRGKRVLDLCAAPGGKTAQLINAGGIVTALDISETRVARMKENLSRLNLNPQKIIVADAIEFLKNGDEKFDIILLDAPCSATGTLRRHPEVVHLKTQTDVLQCSKLQRQMLELAADHLTEGGVLLYSVCSMSKTEGEKQIVSFTTSHDEFKIKPVDLRLIAGDNAQELSELITEEGFLRCLPCYLSAIGGLDGFFIATLQKE